MKRTHGTGVWGDTSSEKNLNKFKSFFHQRPSLFWGLQQLALLFSCSDTAFPSSIRPVHNSDRTLPAALQRSSTRHSGIAVAFQGSKHCFSSEKQQKKAQNTALCDPYNKSSPGKMQIGGILVAISQANQEILLVLRKSTQLRRVFFVLKNAFFPPKMFVFRETSISVFQWEITKHFSFILTSNMTSDFIFIWLFLTAMIL